MSEPTDNTPNSDSNQSITLFAVILGVLMLFLVIVSVKLVDAKTSVKESQKEVVDLVSSHNSKALAAQNSEDELHKQVKEMTSDELNLWSGITILEYGIKNNDQFYKHQKYVREQCRIVNEFLAEIRGAKIHD